MISLLFGSMLKLVDKLDLGSSAFVHASSNLATPTRTELLAQLVEHNTFNVGVTGSIPVGFTKYIKYGLFI